MALSLPLAPADAPAQQWVASAHETLETTVSLGPVYGTVVVGAVIVVGGREVDEGWEAAGRLVPQLVIAATDAIRTPIPNFGSLRMSSLWILTGRQKMMGKASPGGAPTPHEIARVRCGLVGEGPWPGARCSRPCASTTGAGS